MLICLTRSLKSNFAALAAARDRKAQAIIKAQDTEINQMKQWRTAWYKK
jgi:uncharacterized protein (DUF305 family)